MSRSSFFNNDPFLMEVGKRDRLAISSYKMRLMKKISFHERVEVKDRDLVKFYLFDKTLKLVLGKVENAILYRYEIGDYWSDSLKEVKGIVTQLKKEAVIAEGEEVAKRIKKEIIRCVNNGVKTGISKSRFAEDDRYEKERNKAKRKRKRFI